MLLAILYISHLISDFHFQPWKIAERKKSDIKYLLLHCLICTAVTAVFAFLFAEAFYAAVVTAVYSLTHFAADFLRIKLDKGRNSPGLRFHSFVFDQLIHLGVLSALYFALDMNSGTSKLYKVCSECRYFRYAVLYTLLFVLLTAPSAVFIRKLFRYITPFVGSGEGASTGDENSPAENTGKIIGYLERIIASVLILGGQYGAVGMVLTAKSIARFKRLDEKDFAEKYLIGTLTSMAIAVTASVCIKSCL